MKKLVIAALCALALAAAATAYAGRPITRHLDGYITEVKIYTTTPYVSIKSGGSTYKIDVDKSATIMKGGKTVEIGDLAVGDKVKVMDIRQDGKTVVATIDVL